MSSSNESKKPRRSQRLRSQSNKKSGTKSKQSQSKKRKASSSNSSNSSNNLKSKQPPTKKRNTTLTKTWKVGDKVRPHGMPTHYVIKRSVNKNTWEMEHFDGRYRDLIPKAVEDPKSGWSKL